MPHDGKVLPLNLAGRTAATDAIEAARKMAQEVDDIAADGGGTTKKQYQPLKLIEPHKLHGAPIPEREWGVQDWLPIGCVTGNWGDGGTGKTLLSQQLMTSCATGKPWLGLHAMRCRTIGIFCEDDEAELHRRQDRINRAYGIEFDDLDDMAWASAVGDDNALVRFDADGTLHDTARLKDFEYQARAFQARLVVIDTAADTFPDDENKRAAVRAFVSRLNRLANELMIAVLLNLHPSRSGMSDKGDMDGGSTAWSNTVRCRWSLERPKAVDGETADPHARILTRRKSNYSAVGETMKLTWSGGALLQAVRPNGLAVMSAQADEDAVFLKLLRRALGEGQTVSGSANAGNYAPKLFARRPDREGIGKRDLEAAMQRLFVAGQIKMEEYGRASANGRPKRLAVVEEAPDA